MIKNILTLLSLGLQIALLHAQNQVSSKSIIQNAVNNTAVQSPNAAALFRYSETPVSLYTGVPNINIPIYTIKEGDIEIPISISYHAGGIKVTDEASSVGLGWSLNAGGRVSQVVAGTNDFNMYGYYNIFPKNASGYVGSVSGCPVVPWNTSSQINSFYTNDFFANNSSMGTYTQMDFQPDLFLINLPNKTYKAYLDMAKTTKTDYAKFAIAEQPNIDFKIIAAGGASPYVPDSYGNSNFKVVDEKGILYTFDGAKEVSIPLMGVYGAITGVSKYLTKIEDPVGKKVTFSYSPILQSDRISGCRNTRTSIHFSSNFPGTLQTNNNGLTQCIKQSIDESFIEKIEFSNGRIEFYWSDREDVNNSKKLSSIKIYNNYKLIKQFDFNYSYFVAADNLNTTPLVTWLNSNVLSSWSSATTKIFTHRLKLLDVTESVSNEKYTFDYNSTYNLPNKLSFSTDFWGYYNGQNNSDTFIPDPTKYLKDQTIFNITSFNNDQTGYWYNESNAPLASNAFDSSQTYINFSSDGKHYLSDRRASLASLASILTSISYPTGGKTEFEYEPNTFSNFPLQSLLDNNSNTGITNDYSFGGGTRIKTIRSIEKPGSTPITKSYIYDELNQDGTKLISNGNLAELPRFYEIENRCYRKHDVLIANMTNVIDAYTNFYSEPGCSLWNEVFKLSVYEGLPSQGMSTLPQGSHVGYSKVIEQITGKGKIESYFANSYNQTCLSMKPRGSYLAIGNGNITKQRYFNADNTLIKELLYNYKFNYPDNLNTYFISGAVLEPVTSFISKPIGAMQGGNIGFAGETRIEEPIAGLIHNYSIDLYKSLLESTTTKEYFPAGSANYLETKSLTTYNNKYQPNIQKITYPDLSSTETEYNYAQEKGNQLLLGKNMVDIPLEIIVTQINNGVSKTLSKTETVYPTSLPDSQIDNLILPKSIKSFNLSNTSSAITEVTLDKYDLKGNLIQYTGKDGIPVSIIWGYNSSLPIAKIEGTQYNNIAMYVNDIISTSNYDALNPTNEQALLTAEDNLRKNANLLNYTITTYTHDPLIGVTSVTPPSGIREYYRYDSTNRLEKVVDVNNKIIKEFKYSYATNLGAIYYNEEKSQIFTRNNCGGNTVAGTYTYIVPAGTYSDVSILAANQKAIDDINTNGQNMANQNASCTLVISCDFTFSSTLGNPQYSYNSTTTVNNNVNFNLSFSSYGFWQSWSNGINIGKVGTSCIPSVNRIVNFAEGSRQWKIFIDTAGNCTATLLSGTVDPSSSNPLNFNFQYQK